MKLKKILICCFLVISVFANAQDWTGGGLELNDPGGYPNGININMSTNTTWAREFSVSHVDYGDGPEKGKLFGIGALCQGSTLSFGYIGGMSPLNASYTNNPWMVFKPDGKIGINTTTPGDGFAPAPNLKLQVAGDVTINKGFKLTFDNGYYVHAYLSYDQIGADGTNHSTARFLHYGYYGQRFEDNGGVRMVIKQGGNVGIGVNDPGQKLEVNGRMKLHPHANGTGIWMSSTASPLWFTGLNPEGDWRIHLDGNPDFMTIGQQGNVGIGVNDPDQKLEVDGRMKLHSHANGTGIWMSSTASPLWFTGLNPEGGWRIHLDGKQDLMTINQEGYVGIGTVNPQGALQIGEKESVDNSIFSLIVNGKIGATAINIDIDASDWGDYVFSTNYELLSLEETELYIEKNNHLPGVPSAQEIGDKGLDLAKTAELQMVKIEELTLHLIQLQKQLSQQAILIQELQNK